MKTILLLLILGVLFIAPGCGHRSHQVECVSGGLNEFKAALADMIDELADTNNALGRVRLFISFGDERECCIVRYGEGNDFESAYRAATSDERWNETCRPKWMRGEIVSEIVAVSGFRPKAGFPADIGIDPYTAGIAFDPEFKSFLLPGEINAHRIFGKKKRATLKVESARAILKAKGRPELMDHPSHILLFRCNGVFLGENGKLHRLTYGEGSGGRRVVGKPTGELTAREIHLAADYLARQVKPTGEFIYGWNARANTPLPGYNIVRHCGTIWAMASACKLRPEETLKSAIRLASRQISKYLTEYTPNAFLIRDDEGFSTLGGTALAILALLEAGEVLDEDQTDLAKRLGNGILAMKKPRDGYYHRLKQNFKPDTEKNCIYFDGEAALALCRLYGVTQDRKYLDAAREMIDFFIKSGYEKHTDHWQQYCLNEFTKYVDEPKYWDYAMLNLATSRKAIDNIRGQAPVRMELLMAGFETYRRLQNAGHPLPATVDFSEDDLKRSINLRFERLQNHCLFPEVAMYLPAPHICLHAFSPKDKGFRVRIDDVQHTIGGLYLLNRQINFGGK